MMSTDLGRIWFVDNPWPNGHAIQEFAWSGRLDTCGLLWFDLHLETVNYDAEAEPASAGAGDWRSPIVWNNYHSCTVSSTNWADEGSTGLLAGRAESPLAWASLNGLELTADEAKQGATLDMERTPAFLIYLTGHDAVADHRVRFRRGQASGTSDLEWTGRIALAYSGDYELKHSFRALIPAARFQGFAVPHDLSSSQAERLFAAACREAEAFRLCETPDGRVLREMAR